MTSADLCCGVSCMIVCSCWIGVLRVVGAIAACPGISWKLRSDTKCASLSFGVV